MVPGQDLVEIAPPGSEKGGVEGPVSSKAFCQKSKRKYAAVQAAPVAVSGFDHFAETAVAAEKTPSRRLRFGSDHRRRVRACSSFLRRRACLRRTSAGASCGSH